MTIKQRAIKDEDKLKRKEAILDAAASLLADNDYQDISVIQVAKKAGLAKGTLFLYFKTKEELFLNLQMHQYDSMFSDLNNWLKSSLKKNDRSVGSFVKKMAASFNNHPILMKLTPVIHVIFERNIGYQEALIFKEFMLNHVRISGHLLENYFTFLKNGEGSKILLNIQVLIIGLIQLSNPAPVIKEVIKDEKMSVFRLDFEETLTELVTLMLKGMKNGK